MPKVFIKPSGQLIELPRNSPLTALADFQETAITFGCRSGACGSCAIEVLEGRSNLTAADNMQRSFLTTLGYPQERYRLACQCCLQGDITIKPIGS